jgi:hypothetical protein
MQRHRIVHDAVDSRRRPRRRDQASVQRAVRCRLLVRFIHADSGLWHRRGHSIGDEARRAVGWSHHRARYGLPPPRQRGTEGRHARETTANVRPAIAVCPTRRAHSASWPLLFPLRPVALLPGAGGATVPHRHTGLRDEGLASTILTVTTACADEVIALVQVASRMAVTILSWVAPSK